MRQAAQIPWYGWVLAGFALAALAGPFLVPNDPGAINMAHRLEPPCPAYLFGTDTLGRCLFSRIIAATRVSLGTGLAVLLLSFSMGGAVGLVSGYCGGWVDELFMRVTDMFMAVPSLVIALVLARYLGPGISNTIWVISISIWPGYARLVRGLVIQEKQEAYIRVAELSGLGVVRIWFHHIFRAILPPLATAATLGMGRILLMLSSLGFLGLGILEPTPDWGTMLHNGTAVIRTAPHAALFPGLAVSLAILCFNLAGEKAADGKTSSRRH